MNSLVYSGTEITTMSNDLHTSLPIEYQLKYGTACGNLDGTNFMSKTPGDSIGGSYVALPKEELLCDLRINPTPITVDGLDALLVFLNR